MMNNLKTYNQYITEKKDVFKFGKYKRGKRLSRFGGVKRAISLEDTNDIRFDNKECIDVVNK